MRLRALKRLPVVLGRGLIFMLDSLLGLLILVLVLVVVLLGSSWGRTLLLQEGVEAALAGSEWSLKLESPRWRSLSELGIRRLQLGYQGQMLLDLSDVSLEWQPMALLDRQIELTRFTVKAGRVQADPALWPQTEQDEEPEPEPPEEASSLSLYRFVIGRVGLSQIRVLHPQLDQPITSGLTIEGASYQYLAEEALRGLRLDSLELRAMEGRQQLQGQVREARLQGQLKLNEFPLALIEALVPNLEGGWLNADLEVSLDRQVQRGQGTVEARTTYRGSPLSLQTALRLNSERLDASDISASWGAISAGGKGSLRFSDLYLDLMLDRAETTHALLQQLDVAGVPELTWRAQASEASLQGPLDDLQWSGRLTGNGRYQKQAFELSWAGSGDFTRMTTREAVLTYKGAEVRANGALVFDGSLDLEGSYRSLRDVHLRPWIPEGTLDGLPAQVRELALIVDGSFTLQGPFDHLAWTQQGELTVQPGGGATPVTLNTSLNGAGSRIEFRPAILAPGLSGSALQEARTDTRTDQLSVAGWLDWSSRQAELELNAGSLRLGWLQEWVPELDFLTQTRLDLRAQVSDIWAQRPTADIPLLVLSDREQNRELLRARLVAKPSAVTLKLQTRDFPLDWLKRFQLESPGGVLSATLDSTLDADRLSLQGAVNYEKTLIQRHPQTGKERPVPVALELSLADEGETLLAQSQLMVLEAARSKLEARASTRSLQEFLWQVWRSGQYQSLPRIPALALDGSVDLGLLQDLLPDSGVNLRGTLVVDARTDALETGESPLLPVVNGRIVAKDVAVDIPQSGTRLSAVDLSLLLEGQRVVVDKGQARVGDDGKLKLSGDFDWSRDARADLRMNLDKAALLNTDLFDGAASGDLSFSGDLSGYLLGGSIRLQPMTLKLDENFSDGIAEIEVVEKVREDSVMGLWQSSEEDSLLALDLRIEADQQAFLRGRGLNAELEGSVKLTGPVNRLNYRGTFRTVRGSMNLFGKRFIIARGTASLQNGAVVLSVEGQYSDQDIDYTLNLLGTLEDFDLSLSSSPDLPQDELMSRLLFGKSARNISPFQAVRLASAIQTLQGGSRFPDPLEMARQLAGVDQINVESEELDNGDSGVRVGVGKYINDRVYVELERTPDPNKPWAGRVDIELTPQVNLRTTTGSGQQGGVELQWKRDY